MEQDIIVLGTPHECYSPSRRLTYSKQFVSIQTVKYGLVMSHLASYEIQLYRATVHLTLQVASKMNIKSNFYSDC